MRIVDDIKPTMGVGRSQGAVADSGVTYNEVGITYNQLGAEYGGFYGFADVVVINALASIPTPSMTGYADIYTTQGTTPIGQNSGMLIGMLSITYP